MKYVTVQKMKLSIKDFSSKCNQIRSFLCLWSKLLKKFVIENFIFLCSVYKAQRRSSPHVHTCMLLGYPLAQVRYVCNFAAWKVSKYGVSSGPYFPVLGLNTEILLFQSESRKIRTRNNSVFGHFSRSVFLLTSPSATT